MKQTCILLIFSFLSFNVMLAQNWITDFETAKAMSKKEEKPIVLVFQGSDWCAPCIKLNKTIFSTDAFKAYAKSNYVMLQADFPRKKKNHLTDAQNVSNAKLAEVYNKTGVFPLVVVLNKHGKVLGKTGYKKTTPENYIKVINAFIN